MPLPIPVDTTKAGGQAPLPSKPVQQGSSSSEEDFVKVKNNNTSKANQNDDEDYENNNQEYEEEEEEESLLSQRTDLHIDICQNIENFFDEALPPLNNNNNNNNETPLLSITYIDKNIYPADEWSSFVCEMVQLYSQKFDLLQKSFPNNKNSTCFNTGKAYVEMCGCDLGPQNAEIISKNLVPFVAKHCAPDGPNFTLNLENNRLLKPGFDKVSESIYSNSTVSSVLKELNVRENSLRDDSMHNLCKVLHACPHLEDLAIGTCHIFPSGIEVLARNGLESSPYVYKSLKSLSIEFNVLGNQGVARLAQALSKCYAFEKLNISDNSITDEGAAAVSQHLFGKESCGPLRWIDMSVNQIGAKGAQAIADAIADGKSSLEYLDVGCNPITAEGGEAICAAAKTAKRLISLDMTTTDLTEKAGKFLIEALELRPAVFKQAFIFECNQLSFEVRKKIAETMNARSRIPVAEDDEKKPGENLKKYGKNPSSSSSSSNNNNNNEVITNLVFGAGILGLIGVAGWIFLKGTNNSNKH